VLLVNGASDSSGLPTPREAGDGPPRARWSRAAPDATWQYGRAPNLGGLTHDTSSALAPSHPQRNSQHSGRPGHRPDPAQQTGGMAAGMHLAQDTRTHTQHDTTHTYKNTYHALQNPTPQPAMPAAAQPTADLAWHGSWCPRRHSIARARLPGYLRTADIRMQQESPQTAPEVNPSFSAQAPCPLPKLPRRLPTPLPLTGHAPAPHHWVHSIGLTAGYYGLPRAAGGESRGWSESAAKL